MRTFATSNNVYLYFNANSNASKMSVPEVRPEPSFLMPVGHSALDLASRIKFSGSCLRFKAIKWFSTGHALVFAPSFHHELSEGSVWSPSAELTSLHGQIREFFFDEGAFVFYGGTVKCHSMERWSTDGALCPWDEQMLHAIVEVARPHDNLIGRRGATNVMQMYREGKLRLDTMLLECVDFKHPLYNRLLALHKRTPQYKRPQDHMDTPSKKARFENH
ncbi:hypothetical protein DXG01_006729 [Tephrocybe rancida]|nr:hypothetical protein DXG01_006729 [Tephrocybe rancida]